MTEARQIPWLAQSRRPSASGLDRALLCRASCWLDDPKKETEWSRRGTRFHKALERHALGAERPDILTCVWPSEVLALQEHLEKFNALNIERWANLPLCEVECWYNPLTREAEWGVEGEKQGEGFWRGRTDFICKYEGQLAIVDYKTGRPENLPRTTKAGQLGYFALWAREMLAKPVEAQGGVRVVYFAPEAPQPLSGFLTLADLEGWATRFHDLEADLVVDETTGRRPVVQPHAKDRWCPCKKYQEKNDGPL